MYDTTAMANHIYTIYRDFEHILKSIKYSNMSLLWPNPWSLWLTQLNIINVEIQFQLIFDAMILFEIEQIQPYTKYAYRISKKKTSASTWTLNSIQNNQWFCTPNDCLNIQLETMCILFPYWYVSKKFWKVHFMKPHCGKKFGGTLGNNTLLVRNIRIDPSYFRFGQQNMLR